MPRMFARLRERVSKSPANKTWKYSGVAFNIFNRANQDTLEV